MVAGFGIVAGMKTVTPSKKQQDEYQQTRFTCIWWNGGEKRGRWQRTAIGSKDYAENLYSEITQMGYMAGVVSMFDIRHGLPHTRMVGERCDQWTMGKDGFYHFSEE